MDFTPPAKQRELREALELVKSGIVILYGPPGSSKTYTLTRILEATGRRTEYIQDVETYRNALLSDKMVCLTDIDILEHFLRHKERIASMKNLVIETRTLPFIGRHLENSATVSFNRPTDAKLLRHYGLSRRSLEMINGNLHLAAYGGYAQSSGILAIYHYLGKIFYAKFSTLAEAEERGSVHEAEKILGYLHENAVSFMELGDLRRASDAFSLCDISHASFYNHALGVVISAEKRRNLGFYSFRPCRAIGRGHGCGSICNSR
jgi:hypothetical protein